MKVSASLRRAYRFIVKNFYSKPREFIRLVNDRSFYCSQSYYPELKANSVLSSFIYQIGQVLKYGRINRFLFMYGLDVKPKESRKDYLNYARFMERRDFLNNLDDEHNSTCLLRNKLYFYIFAKSLGISSPRIVAYSHSGKLYVWIHDHFAEQLSLESLASLGCISFFCKETKGECGSGIFILHVDDSKRFSIEGRVAAQEEVFNLLCRSEHIVQEVVRQHDSMSRLYTGSINTLRLVTVRSLKDGIIHVMPSILRVGTNGSIVDNTSQGGIAVGFDLDTGRLHEDGFYKPQFGRRVQVHPNSGVRFHDFYIPFIQEAKEQAIKFHSFLKDIHSIGWDIAIGQDGPIFIEGNDNWEINGPQVGNHGLRKEFEEYFYK